MPAPQYEERVTRGGLTVRENGVIISESRSPARPVPVLPPLDGEARARMDRPPPSGPPHQPVTTTHIHEHHAYGHGGGDAVYGLRPGYHVHQHTHQADSSHDHDHAAPSPGSPGGTNMPEVELNSADPGGEVSGVGLTEQIGRFLASQGVDVAASLRQAGYDREHRTERARERAERAKDYARALKDAKRALAFETDNWLAHRPGSSISLRNEASERVTELEGLLRECCVNDQELISEAKRRVAW